MVSAVSGAAIVAGLALCIACQGQGQDPRGSNTGSGPASAATRAVVADAAIANGEPESRDPSELRDARPQTDEPEPVDPSRTIAELGAIPAWQAVVDRAQLLGRRGQRGVVYGRVGPALLVAAPSLAPPPPGAASAGAPASVDAGAASIDAGSPASNAAVSAPLTSAPASAPVASAPAASAPAASAPAASRPAIDAGLVKSPYVWLIDDTEGNGALGIRIALGDKAREGDRIAAGGAWHLDGERRWFWKPDAVQVLPPATPGDLKEPPPPVPSHALAGGSAPAGTRAISLARDNDAVYFQIVGPPPLADGDGWQVADQLGSPIVAVMNLPGERASYGGQDMRAPDERWQLKRGQTYWVRIGKLRKRGDKPTAANARTAPVRVL